MIDGILSIIDYFFENGDHVELARMRNESKKRSEDLVLAHFIKALKKNPNVVLDDLIVSFESGTGTLEEYAKRRDRKPDDYRKSYAPIFARANEMKGKYGTF